MDIYDYSNPKQVRKNAIHYLGKNVALEFSSRPNKKYQILKPSSDKWIHFGQMGYQDYTKHHDETRRKNYLARTAKIKGNWKTDPYSPNNLARHILW